MLRHKKNKTENTLLSQFSTKSGYAESYRTMQTNLQFSAMDKELKTICVTSATEMEGKTNTVANLAYTMASAGHRVLMIDGDLRKPGLTKRFNKIKQPGLTELVSIDLGKIHEKGSLSDIRLEDLIKLKKLQKRTGILSVRNKINTVDLSFHNGDLVDIFWKNRPDSKKLASTLIASNLLTKVQAHVALGQQKKSIQKLGTILTTMGMISSSDLKKHLSMHIVEAFKTAAAIYEGEFTFTPMHKQALNATIDNSVKFDKLFHEFIDDKDHSQFLIKTIESRVLETEIDNLFLLPSGNIPPNPSEMISSDRMAFVLDTFKNLYDFVILDTPPVLPASDALVLSPNTDGILMVVMAGKVNKKYVKDAINQLESGSTKILGLILNKVDVNRERYYKYYKKYYTSYYGKTERQ